jgi:hypothetical protein
MTTNDKILLAQTFAISRWGIPAALLTGGRCSGRPGLPRVSRKRTGGASAWRSSSLLGDTLGKLVVDGYSGYNRVTVPGRRERAGCLAHLRRKFFDAQSPAPDAARRAMGFILDVYRIERAALDAHGKPPRAEPSARSAGRRRDRTLRDNPRAAGRWPREARALGGK